MKEKLLSVLKYLFFLILGGGILYLVLKGKDLNKMLEDLRSAEYKYLVASMVFGYAAYLFRALRWLLLLKTMNYNTSVSHATHAVAAGYFANVIFPRAGEIVRCTSLYKVTGIPVNKLFGTVLLERAIDLVMLVACIAMGFVLKYNELSAFVGSVGGEAGSADLSNTKLLLGLCFFVILLLLCLGLLIGFWLDYLPGSLLFSAPFFACVVCCVASVLLRFVASVLLGFYVCPVLLLLCLLC